MRKIEMVDLKGQYQNIKTEVDEALQSVIDSAAFVKGGKVMDFQRHLEEFLHVRHVIPVGNGTDALMLSLRMRTRQLLKRLSNYLNSNEHSFSEYRKEYNILNRCSIDGGFVQIF